MKTSKIKNLLILVLLALVMHSCDSGRMASQRGMMDKAMYQSMKAGVLSNGFAKHPSDSSNFFDNEHYDPAAADAEQKLIELGQSYALDSHMIVKFDIRTPQQLHYEEPQDTLIVGKEYYTTNLHEITEEELKSLRYNLQMSRKVHNDRSQDGSCHGSSCPVYAHVSKAKQRLYLYLNGELIDSFKTSTGNSTHVTPDFDKKPNGRMYKRYTSHKFPGGDYHGLGNMPYAVFISGGYAIHGTTYGNFMNLGKPRSHGCVRLHPDNAKIFWNVVNYVGPENTWITVKDN